MATRNSSTVSSSDSHLASASRSRLAVPSCAAACAFFSASTYTAYNTFETHKCLRSNSCAG